MWCERERTVRTDREGESHETVARASVRLCAKLAASVYAPSRQEVVGAERGSAERGERRRCAGLEGFVRREGGVDTGTSKSMGRKGGGWQGRQQNEIVGRV